MLTAITFSAISGYAMMKSFCETRRLTRERDNYLKNIVDTANIVADDIVPHKSFLLRHTVPKNLLDISLDYEKYFPFKSTKLMTILLEQYETPLKQPIEPLSSEIVSQISAKKQLQVRWIELMGLQIPVPILAETSTLVKKITNAGQQVNIVVPDQIYINNPNFGVNFLGRPMKLSNKTYITATETFLKCLPVTHMSGTFDTLYKYFTSLGYNYNVDFDKLARQTKLSFGKENMGILHLNIIDCQNQTLYFDVKRVDNSLECKIIGPTAKDVADVKFNSDIETSRTITALIAANYLVIGSIMLTSLIKQK